MVGSIRACAFRAIGLGMALLAGGCSEDTSEPHDATPPPAPTGIHTGRTWADSVEIIWRLPFDAGVDLASQELRWDRVPVDETSWSQAQPVATPPVGLEGAIQSAIVGGLEPSTKYHLGLRVQDSAGNWSPIAATCSHTREADLVVLRSFGGSEVFTDPYRIAVGPGEIVYVADRRNRIQALDTFGNRAAVWEAGIDTTLALAAIGGLACDDAGFVYAGNLQSNRIEKFTADGTPVDAWNLSVPPIDIAISGDRVFVAGTWLCWDAVNLLEFTSSGEPVGSGILGTSGAWQVALDDAGSLYVGWYTCSIGVPESSAKQGLLYFDGSELVESGLTPSVMTGGEEGILYLAGGGIVQRVLVPCSSVLSETSLSFGDAPCEPVSLARRTGGFIYVLDDCRDEVVVLSAPSH